jgi:hypothetical protein
MIKRFVALFALALSFGIAVASAQQTPAPAPTPVNLPTVPPDKKLDPWTKAAIDLGIEFIRATQWRLANQATGEVTYFRRFDMQVRSGANYYRNIHLHQGTIINPRGESIQVGQRVEVGGDAQADGSLNANVITIVNR